MTRTVNADRERREFLATVEPATEAGPVKFRISTASPDRSGDTIALAGWKLDQFKANPIVLFAHDDRQPPIGKAVSVGVEGDALVSLCEFTPKDMYPFGHMIGEMYRGGFMRAVSVGFRALKHAYVEDRGPWGGIDFLEQELLEYSAVPIPANPEALVAAKSAGIDTKPVVEWAERLLAEKHGPGFWASEKTLHRAIKAARTRGATVSVPASPTADQVREAMKAGVAAVLK